MIETTETLPKGYATARGLFVWLVGFGAIFFAVCIIGLYLESVNGRPIVRPGAMPMDESGPLEEAAFGLTPDVVAEPPVE